MLITSLLPLLSRYSLGFDLIVGADDMVTLTIIPRKAQGAKRDMTSDELRPISITAPAAEIDAELAKGDAGALGQLIVARKALGDQLAEQHAAAEAAKTAVKAKATPAVPKPADPVAPPPPADPAPGEPARLW